MFQFCFRVLLLKKFLRRVHKYPVYVSPEDSLPTATTANGGIGLTNGYSGSSSGPGAARHLYDMVQFFNWGWDTLTSHFHTVILILSLSDSNGRKVVGHFVLDFCCINFFTSLHHMPMTPSKSKTNKTSPGQGTPNRPFLFMLCCYKNTLIWHSTTYNYWHALLAVERKYLLWVTNHFCCFDFSLTVIGITTKSVAEPECQRLNWMSSSKMIRMFLCSENKFWFSSKTSESFLNWIVSSKVQFTQTTTTMWHV